MKSAVTVSLVPEAQGGPFIFWEGIEKACNLAQKIGFDGIEIFPPSADGVSILNLRRSLNNYSLSVAAFGTGAGAVVSGLSLSDKDKTERKKAIQFVRNIMELGTEFNAPTIIGSMQGKIFQRESREETILRLVDSLSELSNQGGQLLIEPLNRYETNICNTLEQGLNIIQKANCTNIKILADLFHMNIEEENIAEALENTGDKVGHIHFVDSNRRPAGLGHLNYLPIASALKNLKYSAWASVEAFPYPDSESAARQTIKTYKEFMEGV